jgi:hypothetical protein
MIRNEVETKILSLSHRLARKQGQYLPRLTLIRLKNRFDKLWNDAQFELSNCHPDDEYDGGIRNRSEYILFNEVGGELKTLSEILYESIPYLYPNVKAENANETM